MDYRLILVLVAVAAVIVLLIYKMLLKDIFHFVIATNDDSTAFKERINKENGS